jgi:hypothetical protein
VARSTLTIIETVVARSSHNSHRVHRADVVACLGRRWCRRLQKCIGRLLHRCRGCVILDALVLDHFVTGRASAITNAVVALLAGNGSRVWWTLIVARRHTHSVDQLEARFAFVLRIGNTYSVLLFVAQDALAVLKTVVAHAPRNSH